MAILPDTVRDLLRAGANVEIHQGSWLPDTLRDFARLAKSSGANLTINTSSLNLLPDTLRDLARIGGNNITFRL